MKRLAEEKLIQWKEQNKRKPLLLDGARQVGKTHLIEKEFGAKHFSRVHKFDFRENKKLENLFTDSLQPEEIIRKLEIEMGEKIDLKNDLIFFDEVGECQAAVDSLKFFSEKKSDIFLCASGSNIGLLNSFPVGKTHNLELFPMSFYEFLLASQKDLLIEEFEKMSRLMNVHEKLWSILLDYYFVGGMPEAVKTWFSKESTVQKIEEVSRIQDDLLSGFERDFGKYGGKVNSLHIASVFRSVPLRLQSNIDGSVKRYGFKDIIEGKKQYSQLRGPIDWLEKSKLVSKNYIVRNQPLSPLMSLCQENFFKLFFFDVGLLCRSLGLDYPEVRKQEFFQKGFIAENFVQNELLSIGKSPTFSWSEARSEIEFILKSPIGETYPVEVKSGKRTKARSLGVYKEKYSPKKTIKLIGNRGNEDPDNLVWPLYYAYYLNTIS